MYKNCVQDVISLYKLIKLTFKENYTLPMKKIIIFISNFLPILRRLKLSPFVIKVHGHTKIIVGWYHVPEFYDICKNKDVL